MANHIWRDGGTRKVFIAGRFGLFDDMRLVMRTTSATQIRANNTQMREMIGADDAAKEKKIAEFVASQIIEWDCEDSGTPLKVTGENVMVLQPNLGNRIADIAYGVDGGDPDPLQEEKHPEDTATKAEREGNSAAA